MNSQSIYIYNRDFWIYSYIFFENRNNMNEVRRVATAPEGAQRTSHLDKNNSKLGNNLSNNPYGMISGQAAKGNLGSGAMTSGLINPNHLGVHNMNILKMSTSSNEKARNNLNSH